MNEQDYLPIEIKDALISLHDEHFNYQKYLNVLKDYIYLDRSALPVSIDI